MSTTYFKEYLTESEERQLLRAVNKVDDIYAKRDHAWIRALRFSGCRIDAFSKLNVRHAQQVVRTNYLVLEPAIMKRKQGHEVFISRAGCAAFRGLLRILRQMRASMDPEAPLVLSRNNQRMSVRSYQDRLSLWDRESGLNLGLSPHWLRHTFAKRLMYYSEARDPLLTVQAALGHTNPRSTLQYIWPDKEDMERDLEAASR